MIMMKRDFQNQAKPWCFVTLSMPTTLTVVFVGMILLWVGDSNIFADASLVVPVDSADVGAAGAGAAVVVDNGNDGMDLHGQCSNHQDEVDGKDRKNKPWRYNYRDPALDTSVGMADDWDDGVQFTLPYAFVHKTVMIPHDDKKHRGGEDAASTASNILVIADGVGGWAKQGVDPGLFSRALTKKVIELWNDQEGAPGQSAMRLASLVHYANLATASEHMGTATCTAVQLTDPKNLTMKTVNIGDSGYSIHRSNKNGTYEVVYAAKPGQKQFNFPHQIGGDHGDRVRDVADLNTHKLQQDDIVILWSDGVSDNLHPHQYHDCLEQYTLDENEGDGPSSSSGNIRTRLVSYSVVADCIARTAYALGKDKKYDSPFAQGAREVGKRYVGGKHDDITVVVAQLVGTGVDPKSVGDGGKDLFSNDDDSSDSDSTANVANDMTDPIANEHKVNAMLDDPYFEESIYIYTGPVGSKDDLPTLQDLLQKKEKVQVGSDEL